MSLEESLMPMTTTSCANARLKISITYCGSALFIGSMLRSKTRLVWEACTARHIWDPTRAKVLQDYYDSGQDYYERHALLGIFGTLLELNYYKFNWDLYAWLWKIFNGLKLAPTLQGTLIL